MKKRLDFVTNSSSTSYCVVGVEPETNQVVLPENDSDDGWYGFCDNHKLACGQISGETGVVGLDIHEMKDSETLLEFKKRVLSALKKALPKCTVTLDDISIHVDGGFDG